MNIGLLDTDVLTLRFIQSLFKSNASVYIAPIEVKVMLSKPDLGQIVEVLSTKWESNMHF